MIRALLSVLVVLALAGSVRADDAVALLPLDADQRLEIYGQPVASEIARALVAGQIDVVVVGPKMAVPDRARLIVDGTLASKGESIVLTVRVRNPLDGTVLVTTSSTAATLANIDQAAAEVSARVLPAVRERLAALRTPPREATSGEHDVPRPPPPPSAASKPMLVAISDGGPVSPFQPALTAAVGDWVTAHRRTPVAVEAAKLSRRFAAETVRSSGTDLAISFEIGRYESTPEHGIPLARARVRVRLADGEKILFDRVVVTDSVVGDKDLEPAALAARTAREVLAILRPHLRREVTGWR